MKKIENQIDMTTIQSSWNFIAKMSAIQYSQYFDYVDCWWGGSSLEWFFLTSGFCQKWCFLFTWDLSHQISTCLFISHYLLITSFVAARDLDNSHTALSREYQGLYSLIGNKQVVERNRHKVESNDFRICTKTVVSVKEWNHYIIQSLETKPPLYIVTWLKLCSFSCSNIQWLKASRVNTLHGLVDDPDDQENRHSTAQKLTHLELMLGQIANFLSIISRNTIMRSSTALSNILQTIRMHFGFRLNQCTFLRLA